MNLAKIPEVSIVIPTFNERNNLPVLVEYIDERLAGHTYELIVVDDGSSDGTGELAQKLSENYPIQVVHRNERGLATAVVEGFKRARGGFLVVMDADLQHPPERIPELVKGLSNGADIAIGSRYVEGGKVDGWSVKRKTISWGAKVLAHLFLPPTRDVSDPLSGFFALKKSVISEIDLQPTGYKILLEVIVRGNYDRVIEVPYSFKERISGESKLSIEEHLNYLKHLWKLRSVM